MKDELKIKMYSFTVDCIDPQKLAEFYGELLKWEVLVMDEEWACVYAPGTNQGTYPSILFQRNPEYKPPVWPEEPDAQQQMAHIDFAVNDLERAAQYAINAVLQWQMNNFLMIGELCLIPPDTLFAYVR